MKKIKVCNGHAGIGGNRKDWPDDKIEVTAVEINPVIAKIYKKNYPNDKVIVGDIKEYLLKNFKKFDFIWLSPPCPTHSRIRTMWQRDYKIGNKTSGSSFKFPDMDLYSYIIFLKHFYKGNWVVENVQSYYNPLIKPYVIDNHYIWSNKLITYIKKTSRKIKSQDIKEKEKRLGFIIPTNISKRFRRTLLNNCVNPKIALHIFNCVFKQQQKTLQ